MELDKCQSSTYHLYLKQQSTSVYIQLEADTKDNLANCNFSNERELQHGHKDAGLCNICKVGLRGLVPVRLPVRRRQKNRIVDHSSVLNNIKKVEEFEDSRIITTSVYE